MTPTRRSTEAAGSPVGDAYAGSVRRARASLHMFIQKGWDRAAQLVETCRVETVSDLRALVDAVLAAQKDQRVIDGGVSDRAAMQVAAADGRDRILGGDSRAHTRRRSISRDVVE